MYRSLFRGDNSPFVMSKKYVKNLKGSSVPYNQYEKLFMVSLPGALRAMDFGSMLDSGALADAFSGRMLSSLKLSNKKSLSKKKVTDMITSMENKVMKILEKLERLNTLKVNNSFLVLPDAFNSKDKINTISTIFSQIFDEKNNVLDSMLKEYRMDETVNSFITDLKRIGADSVNGIIFRTSLGNKIPVIIKMAANEYSDDLGYEYHIQDLMNPARAYCPNFTMAYALFNCSPSLEIYEILTNIAEKTTKRTVRPIIVESQKKLGINMYDVQPKNHKEINKICRGTEADGATFLMAEIVDKPITLAHFCEKVMTTYEEFVNIMFQVMAALEVGYHRYKFTHYDLHAENVILKPVSDLDKSVKPGSEVNFVYEFDSKDVPYVVSRSKYLAAVIDFGRSYHKDKKMGFNGSSPRDKNYTAFDRKYHITPNKPNPCWDAARIFSVSCVASMGNKNLSVLDRSKIKCLYSIGDSVYGYHKNLYLSKYGDAYHQASGDFDDLYTPLFFIYTIFSYNEYGMNYVPVDFVGKLIPEIKFKENEHIYLFNSKTMNQTKYKLRSSGKNKLNDIMDTYALVSKKKKEFLKSKDIVKVAIQHGGGKKKKLKLKKIDMSPFNPVMKGLSAHAKMFKTNKSYLSTSPMKKIKSKK